MTSSKQSDIADQIGQNLPYLRRYARALTGHQDSGDRYAAATLEAILADPAQYNTEGHPKTSLFAVFHAIWVSSGMPVDAGGEIGLPARAQARLSGLSENTREALLLHTVEEFTIGDIARIMDITDDEAQAFVDTAIAEMNDAVAGRVMIVEDEAVIALDLETIVADMGHKITGIARTETEAVYLFNQERPDLILSDIQLADGSSGIDAVNRILAKDNDMPVIFITAFPERLLTGDSPEPAFLISKPFTERQVEAAVSQAMFFSSTETLT